MESAIFGLIGVALGALLTIVREWWFQNRKERKEIDYLAVQVSCILDRYAGQCSLAASDGGAVDEEPNREAYRYTSVTPPILELDSSKFEWKFLPASLMHALLRLPFEAETAEIIINQSFEFAAAPPDFEEGFEERQFQYATLGLRALELACQLRRHAKLNESISKVELSVESHLKDVLSDIKKARASRESSNFFILNAITS